MVANNTLFAITAVFILHVSNSCSETKNQLRINDDCTATTSTHQNIFLYTNTSIAQKITFCQISDYKQYNSFRILLNSTALTYEQIISNFRYTFNLYYFDEWILANCNHNLYDQQLCTISPIITFTNTATLRLSSFGKHNQPYITIDFPNKLTINSSYSYTSLIWTLYINQGMDPIAANDIYFIACDLISNTNNAQYIIYPPKYNTNTENSTVFISTLSEICTEKMDNTLTELNPSQCSQRTGFKFERTGDSLFQYFAVTETKTVYGINLYFEIPPHLQSGSECTFTAAMKLFELQTENGNEIELTGIQNIVIDELSDTASLIQFIFSTPITVTIDNESKYFYFQITIVTGITGGAGGSEPGSKQPGGGSTEECSIAVLVCYDSSYMKTWYVPAGQSYEVCKDESTDQFMSTQYNNVDVAFDLVTSLSSDTTTPLPTETAAKSTRSFYTTNIIETIITTEGGKDGGELETDAIQFEESQALLVTIAVLVSLGVLLLFIAFLCATFTKADNFVYSSVLVFVVHSIDVFSDIFFCISLITDHVLVTTNGIFLVLAICSLLFIIAPMTKNFYDLIQFQRLTQNDPLHGDRYRAWLSSFGTTLLVFSLISGSTFGAMKLMNSNLLGLRMFSMGLCLSHLREYHSYRMVNVVLMENLPQLIIQIIFTAVIPGKVPIISILAAITSICSIIVAIVDHFSQKEIRKQAVPSKLFTFKITSKRISFKPKQYRNRQKTVSKSISKILELDMSAVEILTINEYSDQMSDGLIIYFLITTIKYESDGIHLKLKDSINNGSMLRNMKRAWKLTDIDQPRVFALKWLQIQSVPTNEEMEGHNLTSTTTHVNKTEMAMNTTIKLSDHPTIESQKSSSKKKTIVVIADEETGSNEKKGIDEQISPMPSPIINDFPSNDSDFPKMEHNVTNNSDLV